MEYKEEEINSSWDGSVVKIRFIKKGFFDESVGELDLNSKVLKIRGGLDTDLVSYVKSRGYSYDKVERM
jgi:hypothetical protein